MSKVRNFSEIAPNNAFPEFNFYEFYYSTFEKSELDRIKKLLPLREMAANFDLVEKHEAEAGVQVFFVYFWRKSDSDFVMDEQETVWS